MFWTTELDAEVRHALQLIRKAANRDLPEYRYHKNVWALKIKEVEKDL
jgi:hypothetical protein